MGGCLNSGSRENLPSCNNITWLQFYKMIAHTMGRMDRHTKMARQIVMPENINRKHKGHRRSLAKVFKHVEYFQWTSVIGVIFLHMVMVGRLTKLHY